MLWRAGERSGARFGWTLPGGVSGARFGWTLPGSAAGHGGVFRQGTGARPGGVSGAWWPGAAAAPREWWRVPSRVGVHGTGDTVPASERVDDRRGEIIMIRSSENPVQHAQRILRRLFPEDPELTEAIAWARQELREAQLDPATAPLRSLRVLRRADRRLTFAAARYLVDAAAGRAPRLGEPYGSPLLD